MSALLNSDQSPRGRRARRYRQVAHILWEEHCFSVLHAWGLALYVPGPVPHGGGEGAQRQEPPSGQHPDGRDAPPEVRLRRALERMGPAFIKIGQILSTRRDLIDPALAAELAKLQDEVPALPWAEMAPTLVEELGGPPGELFAEFDTSQATSASLGQVYRARLHDGRPVAVKIQRPGTRESVEVDLDILLTQARFLERHSEWARDQNAVAIAEDIVGILLGELDYLREARNMDMLRAAFEDDEHVYFPAPVWDLTTSRVLTMDLVEGIPGTHLEELHEAGVDTEAMVRMGVDCYFTQIFELGRYHADPHAGNLFAMPAGRVGFVDFGRIGIISWQHRQGIFDLLLAIMDDDAVDATEALLSVCTTDHSMDVGALQQDLAHVVSLYRASRGRPDVLQLTVQEALATLRRHHVRVPGEIVQLLATLTVLEGVATQISPGFVMLEAVRPHARRLLIQSFGPHAWRHELGLILRRYRKLLEELPVAVNRTLRRAGEGEFRLAVRPADYEDALRGLQDLADRLALAILMAAFVLAFAYITAQPHLPDWLRWITGFVLAVSAVIAAFLLASIILALRRRRRP